MGTIPKEFHFNFNFKIKIKINFKQQIISYLSLSKAFL